MLTQTSPSIVTMASEVMHNRAGQHVVVTAGGGAAVNFEVQFTLHGTEPIY